MVERRELELGGRRISYLEGGEGPVLLLLHGTYWSRVWQPVAPALAESARVLAPDFPGLGMSGGRLRREEATVPSLAEWTLGFLSAAGADGQVTVAGHDIGGAVAQRLVATAPDRFPRLALVNSVLYDSWPVPAVERFRDPELAASITPAQLVEMRRESLLKAVGRELSAAEQEEYLAPWADEDGARSWLALAAAADARFTLELVEALRTSRAPKLLVWGEADEFQPVSFAERFEREMPSSRLVRLPGVKHIPMEENRESVTRELTSLTHDAYPK